MKQGSAVSYGAITVVNAMANGLGAAIGIDLWTKATVTLTSSPGLIVGKIIPGNQENKDVIRKSVGRVLEYFKISRKYGAQVVTESNIPIARGLKSSSAAANAIILATCKALDKKLGDLTAVKLGVEACLDAKVTVTGAFDDACASYFGGLVITDNNRRRILKRLKMPSGLQSFIHVPRRKIYTRNIDATRLKKLSSLVSIAHEEALKGNVFEALTLNGLIYSSAFGYDSSVIIDLLEAGALASGITGKGPAVAALVTRKSARKVDSVLRGMPGKVIKAQINLRKSHTIDLPATS